MEKRGRGRPAFKPTAAQRRSVEQMKSCGETKETIARSIGIDVDTLDKHFVDELANGQARRRAEVIDLLFKAARKGNVTAQRTLSGMIDLAMAHDKAMGDDVPAETQEHAERAAKLGKKELAELEAEHAAEGTEWGSDLDPMAPLN